MTKCEILCKAREMYAAGYLFHFLYWYPDSPDRDARERLAKEFAYSVRTCSAKGILSSIEYDLMLMKRNIDAWDTRQPYGDGGWYMPEAGDHSAYDVYEAYRLRRAYDYFLQAKQLCELYLQQCTATLHD
jgi:hypothetical protein